MRGRPLVFTILAVALFLTPLWLCILMMIKTHVELRYWTVILHPAFWTPQVIALCILCPIVGFGIWRAHAWGYWTGLAGAITLFVNNLVVLLIGKEFHSLYTLAANLAILALAVYFSLPRTRTLFFNSRLRWWEQAKRYEASDVKVRITRPEHPDTVVDGKVFDISETGVFVVGDFPWKGHDVILLAIDGLPSGPLNTNAEVVWHGNDNHSHPTGAGCRFVPGDKAMRLQLRHYLNTNKARIHERRRTFHH